MKPVCFFLCVAAGISAQAATFNMLSCCPGENNATQARFVWHSDSDACTLWYAKASAPGSAKQATCESVSKPVTFRNSDVSYYKYTAALSSLDPGTEYIYWVEAGGSQSGVQRFKTAGTSGSYNFLWMSDVHSHPDNPGKMNTVELLRQDAESRTASSGGIDFVLFSGDAVKYGSRYDNWQQWNGSPAVTNYMFAMIPGNKEYYYTGSSTFYDYYWYLTVKNNPPNGPGTTEQEGCYWFLRDSVLFVGIDSLIHKGSRMARYNDKTNVLRDQTNWFDRVVSEQKSKKSFRYLVVVQHDPWFVYAASKDSFDKSRGNYDTWRHVFDKHKVDLALSGDEHNYIRTKPLRSDAANSDGTIYMVAGQIEESNYSATITTSISDYGNANATKYFDCMGATDASCGAAWIEVRPDSLKVTEFWDKYQSPNYKKYDSVTITPKDRGFVYDPGGVHGKWLGGNGGNRFSVAANWDDGEVPEAGDALDFSSVTSATTIEADVNAAFGAVTMGTGVVTFTGNLTATSFSDTSKIAVGANATVTLVGDLTYTTTGGGWMLNRLDGTFVVTGKIVVSGTADMKLAQTVGSSGVAIVKGLVSNGGTSWTFRLNRSNSGDTARWVIGEDGLSGGSGFWMLAASSSSSAILQPNTNDFTIADWVGARSGPSLTVNTTGWGDGVGHVVTATKGFIREGVVTVAGAGTLVCDYDASAGAYGQTAHSVSFNVRDTATMSLAAGSKIGTGGVTVNSGAALSLSGTGTATMGGTLTLQGGSRIVVGAAGAGRPPYLTAKGVSLAGNSITVEIPSQAVGTFTVLTRTDGSFSDTDLAKLSLSVASPDASLVSSLVLADGGKSIAVSTVAAWPANWNGGHAASAAMQTAFTAWAATPGNDATAARAEGAFLLGLNLADYKEDMKIVGVAIQGNKFTIDTNVDLTKVRGRLYVLVADSPADIVKSGTKITGTVADITKLVNIDASAPAKFFKVGIDYAVEE